MKLTKYKWRCISKGFITRTPWGFKKDPDDPERYIPIPFELDALEKAKEYLEGNHSTRQVAEWLSAYAGRSISHTAMINRIKKDSTYLKSEEYLNFPSLIYTDEGKKAPPQDVQPPKKLVKKFHTESKKQIIKAIDDPVQRKLKEEELKVAQAKRNLTRSQNKISEIIRENKEEQPEILKILSAATQERVEDELITEMKEDEAKEIIFAPNPGPQTEFLAAEEDQLFYGGAKGGGKSYGLLADPVRYFSNKNFRGLIIRRTMPELRDLIYKSKELYKKVDPGAKFKVQENMWHFSSGARLEFGYAETEDDAERYRGQAYTWAGIDELPLYPDSSVYDAIVSCVRSVDPTLPTYIRATGNPGSVGSAWVKEKFIDPAPANTTFFNENTILDPRTGKTRVVKKSLKYIPATVWDNPYLIQDDDYVAALAALPEIKRKQLLEGNWDAVENGAFEEFNRAVHVVQPFPIPQNWPRFRAADWGYSSPFCCLWFASDFDGRLYVYREWYDKGIVADKWAEKIADIEEEGHDYVEDALIDGSTDSNRGRSGPTIFEEINNILSKRRVQTFRFADRSAGSRIAGKAAVHKWLALRKDGQGGEAPNLVIFNTCVNLIKTLPLLPLDPNDPEKVAKKNTEDHAYDALHYGLRSRPMTGMDKHINVLSRGTRQQVLDRTLGY